jgi:hypothetical protein
MPLPPRTSYARIENCLTDHVNEARITERLEDAECLFAIRAGEPCEQKTELPHLLGSGARYINPRASAALIL